MVTSPAVNADGADLRSNYRGSISMKAAREGAYIVLKPRSYAGLDGVFNFSVRYKLLNTTAMGVTGSCVVHLLVFQLPQLSQVLLCQSQTLLCGCLSRFIVASILLGALCKRLSVAIFAAANPVNGEVIILRPTRCYVEQLPLRPLATGLLGAYTMEHTEACAQYSCVC